MGYYWSPSIKERSARNYEAFLRTYQQALRRYSRAAADLEAVANEIILLRKGVVLERQKPASLLEQLNGQVWLVTVPAADEAALTKQYTCSNVMHTDGKSVIRLLSKSAPRPDAVPTAPNMEDMYLYYFGR